MKQFLAEVIVNTRARSFHDITGEVDALVRRHGIRTGLATLHLQHTSASL